MRKLVQSDSINPPGNEKNVAVIIEEFLKESGITTEIFPFGNNRANLVAYLHDSFEGRNLLFNGHMDTVPPGPAEDWKYPPLSAMIKRNKYMFGRGTIDMKGGLAAMVIALKILKELKIEVTGNLILNAVADEETGSEFGIRPLIEKNLFGKDDLIIVPDGGNGEGTLIEVSEKTMAKLGRFLCENRELSK